MKKTTFIVLSLTFITALWTSMAFADPGASCHFHGKKSAAEATVSACAMQRKDALVQSNKLDVTWRAIKPKAIEVVEGKKGKEWKLTFKDLVAKDKSKETPYMFYTQPGNFIATNFIGQ